MILFAHALICLLTLCLSLNGDVSRRWWGEGYLEESQTKDGTRVRILHLKGTPYEMGFQHGTLLKDLIKKNVAEFIDSPQPALASRANGLKENLPKLLSYSPARFKEEMQGVADGSGVSMQKIIALNTFPELIHCSGITVSGAATKNGDLYHVRVLDYAVGKSLQNSAVLMVVQPENHNAFVNVSYAGFIGSVTGMNDKHIAMGEIGGWGYGHWNGMPMSFLFREVLERAGTLEMAKQLLAETPRTCEYYYILSDGKDNTSVGVYATESQIRFIEQGTGYALFAPKQLPANYGDNGDHDKFCIAPSTVKYSKNQMLLYDAENRLSMLFHQQPQDCLLLTGYSHPERYPHLVERVFSSYGTLDEMTLQAIIKRPVARESNLHNAIFLPSQLKLWVSQAGPNDEPACDQPYTAFSLSELLR
jgi:isopenicillin-N N-acyltransferase-like protein